MLDVTNQSKPGELRPPGFGETDAYLDYSKKQEKVREEFIVHTFKFFKELVFKALCPNLEHKPESSLKLVTQIQKDTSGNVTRIPMPLYLTNVSVMAGCLGKKYPVDIVDHGLANMDPIVRDQLLAIWDGHRLPRERDAFSQTQALLEMKKWACQAEDSVMNTQRMIANQNAQIFASVPGYAAAAEAYADAATALPADGSGGAVTVHASQAQRTIEAHSRIPDFVWGPGKCWICGGDDHMAKTRDGTWTCPRANAPNTKENFEKNLLWSVLHQSYLPG